MQDKDSLSHFISDLAQGKESLVLGLLFSGENQVKCLEAAYNLLKEKKVTEVTVLIKGQIEDLPYSETGMMKWLLNEINGDLSPLLQDSLNGKIDINFKVVTFGSFDKESPLRTKHIECRAIEVSEQWLSYKPDFNFALVGENEENPSLAYLLETPALVNVLLQKHFLNELSCEFVSLVCKRPVDKKCISLPKSAFSKSFLLESEKLTKPKKPIKSLRQYVLSNKLIEALPDKVELIWQQESWPNIMVDQFRTSDKKFSLLTSALCRGQLDLVRKWGESEARFSNPQLQKIYEEKKITKEINLNIIDTLLENRLISSFLLKRDFEFLQYEGVFKEKRFLSYRDGSIYTEKGEKFSCDLMDPENKKLILNSCLGNKWKNIYSCRILDSRTSFYRNELDQLSVEEFSKYKYQQLSPALSHSVRIIRAKKVSLSGGFFADNFDYSPELQGYGPRYIFLESASILNGELVTNIESGDKSCQYKFTQDDIIVTEYGSFSLKGLSLEERTLGLINLADARFQERLLRKSKLKKLVGTDCELSEHYHRNEKDFLVHHFETKYHEKYKKIETAPLIFNVTEWYKSKFKFGLIGFIHMINAYIDKVDKAELNDIEIVLPKGFLPKIYFRFFTYSLRKSSKSA